MRFDTAFRGYRMDQVDEVIGRLAQEIDGLQARLAATSEGSPSGVDAGVVEAPEHLP